MIDSIQSLRNFLIEYFKDKDVNIYLFGSRARGEERKYSDIDIAIDSKEDLKYDLVKLKEIIEESNLIYKVDLVELKKVKFLDKEMIKWL